MCQRFINRGIVLFFFLAICLINCSKKRIETFVFGLPSKPASLAPIETGVITRHEIIPHIYETLVTFDDDSLEIKPLLAESWQLSDDGLCFTFHLRPNIKFHDGTPFCAQSTKFSFNWFMDPNNPLFLADKSYQTIFDIIKKINVIDSSTIQIHLKYCYAPFLNLLCNPMRTSIVSSEALKKYGSDIGTHPIGTGPFKFDRWDKNNTIFLEHNSNYWKKSNRLNLIFKVIEDPIQQILALKKSEIHMLVNISPIYLRRLNYDVDIEIHWQPLFHVYFLGFNCAREPFNNKTVRHAVAMSIDRASLISRFHGNSALLAGSILPGILLKVQPWSDLIYDPQIARDLLKKTGFIQHTPLKLLCHHYIKDRIAVYPQSIKEELKRLGLNVEIVYFDEWSEYDKAVKAGQGHLFLDGCRSNIADPDDFFKFLFYSSDEQGNPNLFRYSNPQIDSLIISGRALFNNPDQRKAIYIQIENILNDDLPCIPLCHRKLWYVLNKRVKNFKTNIIGIPHLENVELNVNQKDKN